MVGAVPVAAGEVERLQTRLDQRVADHAEQGVPGEVQRAQAGQAVQPAEAERAEVVAGEVDVMQVRVPPGARDVVDAAVGELQKPQLRQALQQGDVQQRQLAVPQDETLSWGRWRQNVQRGESPALDRVL